MKKFKLNEQSVEGDDKVSPDKKVEVKDDVATLKKMRDVYKCSFLEGTTIKGPIGNQPAHALKIAATDSKTAGLYSVGDTLIIKTDFTFDVFTKGGTDASGKKIKRVFKTGEKGGKWKCASYQKETTTVTSDTTQLTSMQRKFIEDLKKSEGLVELGPDKKEEINSGRWEKVDLNLKDGSLFPEPKKYYLYKRVGERNIAPETPQQDQIITSLEKIGYMKVEPSEAESQKYIKVDLREMEGGKYKKYFSTPFYMWQPITSVNVQDILSQRKATLDIYSVNRKECRQTIDTLHTFYFKGIPLNDNDRIQLKNHAKRCLKQKEFGRGVDKKVAKLAALPKTDPFSLAESKKPALKSVIHESLIKIKENKRTLVLEEKIIKNRFKFIIESYKNDRDDDKLFRNLVYEFNYLHNQGYNDALLNEISGEGILSWFFGRAGGGAVDTFVERMIQALAKGMGFNPDSAWTKLFAIAAGNIEMSDLPKLFRLDCGYISGLMTKTIVELGLQKLGKKTGLDLIGDMLRNTLDSMFRSEGFEQQFQDALSKHLCPILAKFTTNASKVDQSLTNKLMTT
jgi:hypothetical protein